MRKYGHGWPKEEKDENQKVANDLTMSLNGNLCPLLVHGIEYDRFPFIQFSNNLKSWTEAGKRKENRLASIHD